MLNKHLKPGDEERKFADEFIKNPEMRFRDAPERLSHFFNDVMKMIAQGRNIDIVSESDECTTQEAADILNVSRTFLVKLLEEGHIPFHLVGHYRRVMLADVLKYDRDRKRAARKDFGNLISDNQELGLYE